MNKRGFIRTLEAVLAIIIVFLFIYYAGRSSGSDQRYVQGIRSLEESILDEISKNDEFRQCIVSTSSDDTDGNNKPDIEEIGEIGEGGKCPEIKQFIEDSLPSRFKDKYAFNVCDPGELGSCSLPSSIGKSKEVYTSAVIISSSLKDGKYNPRILRMWLF